MQKQDRRRAGPLRIPRRKEGGCAVDGKKPFGELWRGGHGEHEKTEGRYAGGPLFLEASNLFNLPTGPTLGRRAAQVKAESGAKAAGFRQKNRATPFREGRDRNQQKAAVPKGGGRV